MTAIAPPELAALGLDREKFRRADAKSWRGPCPSCGGHRRLLIFTDHPFPKWHVLCNGCGMKAWADQLNTALRQPISDAQRQEWVERNRREAEQREAYRRQKLAEFTTTELLAELHERLTAEHRQQWRSWGVPDEWQDHLRLGFSPEKVYRGDDGELHTSASYTIPYYHTGYTFCTLQYRLFNPPTPTDRYRFEQGLGTAYYQAEPAKELGDIILICEGAKKAIVANVYGGTGATVLAIPSKGDSAGIIEAVKAASRVYILLDPDGLTAAHRLAKQIGKKTARVVELPTKIDDGLMRYGLTHANLHDAMKGSRTL